MSELALRRWLSKHPHPSVVVAEFSDGTEKRVRINVGKSRWRDAEEAMSGVVRAEALDEQGATLRTWESDDAPETKKKEPTVIRDIELARILSDTADRAVARYTEIVKEAFAQNTRLTTLVFNRLTAIERAYQARIEAEAEAVAAEAEALAQQAETSQADGLATQVVAGILSGGMNGAASKEKEG